MENERWSFFKKYTEIWYFLQTFWKDGLSKKAAPVHDLYIIWNNGIFFPVNMIFFPWAENERRRPFSGNTWKYDIFCVHARVLQTWRYDTLSKKNQGWSYPAKIHLDWHPRKNSSNSLYFHEEIYRRFHALLSIEIKKQET